MKMNFEIIPKVKEKQLIFSDLSNGDIFKFKNVDADHYLWMKIDKRSAMKLSDTSDITDVFIHSEVSKYKYKIIIEGK